MGSPRCPDRTSHGPCRCGPPSPCSPTRRRTTRTWHGPCPRRRRSPGRPSRRAAPRTRAQLVVRAVERHEREILVRDAEPRATRPSESSISISPALMTRLRIRSSPRPDVDLSLGRAGGAMCVLRRPKRPAMAPRRRTHGFSHGGTGRGPDVRNRRDPKVTAVSHRGLYGRTSGRSTGSNGFVTLSRSAPSAGWRPRAAGSGFDADPGSVGNRQRPVRRQDERLGQVLGEVPRGRARVAGQPEVRERGQREVRRTTDPGLEHPPHHTGTPSSDATSCTRLASRSPPTRPA